MVYLIWWYTGGCCVYSAWDGANSDAMGYTDIGGVYWFFQVPSLIMLVSTSWLLQSIRGGEGRGALALFCCTIHRGG